MKDDALSIFIINCDWRDIFRNSHQELIEKQVRDQLMPERNRLFFLSWSPAFYHAQKGNLETLHLPWALLLKPILGDLLLLAVAPFAAWRYRVKPDVVMVYDFGFLPAAWLTAKLSGARLVMYVNNMPRLYSATRRLGALKSAYSALLETLWHGLPEAYCTINAYMTGYLEKIGVPRGKIHLYIVDTIAPDAAYIEKAPRGRARSRMGIPEDALMLLTVARLEPEKDHTRLIRLLASVPRAHLVLIGQGSLKEQIREAAERTGVADHVHFAGRIERDHIWEFYKDADAFVLLSKAEALGIVFWEAMYVRVPVIGSDIPGIVESLGGEYARGVVLPDGAAGEDFAKAVAFATTPSPERDAMVERARAYVCEQQARSTTINDIVRSMT